MSSPTKENTSLEEDELPKVFSSSKKSKLSNSGSNQCPKVLFPPDKETPLTKRCLKTSFSKLIQPEKILLPENDSPLTKKSMSVNLDLQTLKSDPNVIELIDSPEDESASEELVLKKPVFMNAKPETVLVIDQSPVRATFKPNTSSNPILIEDTPPTLTLIDHNKKKIIPEKNNKVIHKDKSLTSSLIINNNVNKELPSNKAKNIKARVKLKKLDVNQIALRASSRERKVKSFSDEYILPNKMVNNNDNKGTATTMNKSKSDSAILALKKDNVKNTKLLIDLPQMPVSGRKPFSTNNNNNRSCGDLTTNQKTTNSSSTSEDDPIMLQALRKIPDIEFMRVTRRSSREKFTPTKMIRDEIPSNPSSQKKVGVTNEIKTADSVAQKLFAIDDRVQQQRKQSVVVTYDFIIKRECRFVWKPTALHSQLVRMVSFSLFTILIYFCPLNSAVNQ